MKTKLKVATQEKLPFIKLFDNDPISSNFIVRYCVINSKLTLVVGDKNNSKSYIYYDPDADTYGYTTGGKKDDDFRRWPQVSPEQFLTDSSLSESDIQASFTSITINILFPSFRSDFIKSVANYSKEESNDYIINKIADRYDAVAFDVIEKSFFTMLAESDIAHVQSASVSEKKSRIYLIDNLPKRGN